MTLTCKLTTALLAGGITIVFLAAPLATGTLESSDREDQEKLSEEGFAKIMQGLKKGMWALRELGLGDAVERLERIAADLEEEQHADRRHKSNPEREHAIQEVEIMGAALGALREAKREDAADLLERAIMARKVSLEGRRDEEAREIRERAPGLGDQAELLMLAADLYADWGHERRAETVGGLGRRYAELARRRERGRDEEGEGRHDANELREALKVMRLARAALREGDRREAAGRLERAMHVVELELEGHEGPDLREASEEAPGHSEMAEILALAARLYDGWGNGDRAERVADLAHRFAAAGEGGEEGEGLWQLEEHLQELFEQMEELTERVEQVEHAIERMRRAWRDR